MGDDVHLVDCRTSSSPLCIRFLFSSLVSFVPSLIHSFIHSDHLLSPRLVAPRWTTFVAPPLSQAPRPSSPPRQPLQAQARPHAAIATPAVLRSSVLTTSRHRQAAAAMALRHRRPRTRSREQKREQCTTSGQHLAGTSARFRTCHDCSLSGCSSICPRARQG